ncbi:MAG: UDP-N-acetylmuramate--L-alanine ligase [Nitrosomonadales bacterium]|jgi:UDP-N-acetylmuramate--alanine ligase|nr:UDP-N-acetylmuramate--L-alanine ligase [Nitrosomonadales bacterium]MBT6014546.1 UDP-N-acetylmuramate--L-alanine ligase [Nitrosomonadales bacterium]MBT6250498.1 UDP-N-acetylmuramate--L-alanine ligase [Nitrosomonadales bacterium]MBT6602376.1 UDP-N-acetylmuramate--L-alanine ligase [Nitrosomonadales bacterium]MBT7407070.1 UDP-N-acetylmuramate--L-alanine ligase [Nitrosomonadales bacterium]
MKNKIKKIHFIGIGGSGMSGIAEVMKTLGFIVSGSDLTTSDSINSLKKLGIKIYSQHDKSNVKKVDTVVFSNAIPRNNPEIIEAKKNKIPIISRAEMLSELMRFKKGIAVAGTHGKTTTTSLIASILTEAKIDPTYVIGGKLNSMLKNAKLGKSNVMVVEADESDASFLHLNPINTVVTNIDRDHLENYQGDFERLKQTYVDFIHQAPFYENIFLCIDDKNLKSVIPKILRPIVTYGTSKEAQIRAIDIAHEGRKVKFRVVDKKYSKKIFTVSINFPGVHFVRNTLAAIAIALEYQVSIKAIKNALTKFEGVGRRYEVYKNISKNQKNITVIDDYGHHPTELEAVIKATKKAYPRKEINLVFQPHRYSRTRDCYDELIRVLQLPNQVFLFDIYSAGELKINQISSKNIIKKLKTKKATYLTSFSAAERIIFNKVNNNSIVLIMGAGNISNFVRSFISD